MNTKWSHRSAVVFAAAIALVAVRSGGSNPFSPTPLGAASASALRAPGDLTNSTPVEGVAKVCKSGNVSGTFTVELVQGAGAVASPLTVAPGECRVAAEAVPDSQPRAQFRITETSAGLQSVSGQTCQNSVANGPCDFFTNVSFTNGGIVEVFNNGDNRAGARLTFVNNVSAAVALFVIGDVEPHAVGDIVNFWGAQWWKNNQMSGFVGKGVASFKGYATESDNVCGGTWITRPGNSSVPPATIPAIVSIIVTDTVVKNGSDISGTIRQIVNVQHDGNYSNNPGHAGSGPVVSIVCR